MSRGGERRYDVGVRLFASLALAAVALASCTSSSSTPAEPPCVQGLSASCQAQYDPPAYATIYAKILQPTCATGRGTCHTADAAKGGLSLDDADRAYALLLGQNGAKARVLPGDASCSLLMKRLTSTDPNFHMPPGSTSLTQGELCTITQWIAQGAKR